MTLLTERLAKVIEECGPAVSHPNLASWERDWLLTWQERTPLSLSAVELDCLGQIESIVLGRVRS